MSCLGNDLPTVAKNLREGRSGIRSYARWAELGLPSTIGGHLEGVAEAAEEAGIPKLRQKMMGPAALLTTIAAQHAIHQARLDSTMLASERTGCFVGSGFGCSRTAWENGDRLLNGKARRISPYSLVRSMSNTTSANVVQMFGIGGRSYSISSACATSAHAIGQAFELIRFGVLDRALVGGAEEISEFVTACFCAMRMALSTHFNRQPERASRPFDADRDGFVISGGSGVLVLEELECACRRGILPAVEVCGFGANSDNYDMVQPDPSGQAVAACMRQALDSAGLDADSVGYVNAHGTATPVGDSSEMKALRTVFGDRLPLVSSTKSMGGHPISAAGVHEVIHCMLMISEGFVAPSINIENLAPEFEGIPIVTATREVEHDTVMTTNLGFGGANAALVLRPVRRPRRPPSPRRRRR